MSDGCRQIEFEPAHSADGKRLRNHLIRTEDVMYDDLCDVLCFMDPDCVSYNVKAASTDGKYKCELNNSTFEGEIENLEENSEYRYRGIKVKELGFRNYDLPNLFCNQLGEFNLFGFHFLVGTN